MTVALRTYGGPGSGNFGHAGRPGQIGGSAVGGRTSTPASARAIEKKFEKLGVYAVITHDVLVRDAAERTYEIMKEFKEQQYVLPKSLTISRKPMPKNEAAVSGEYDVIAHDMFVHIPDTLPDDADLDEAVRVAYSGADIAALESGESSYLARTFKDVVVHELGHGQRAIMRNEAIPFPKAWNGTLDEKSERGMNAAGSVSKYAMTHPSEFLAEAFLKQYNGGKLIGDAQDLYDAFGGVKVTRTFNKAAERLLAIAMLRVFGGPGSGNFGHAGRPGQIGGSSTTSELPSEPSIVRGRYDVTSIGNRKFLYNPRTDVIVFGRDIDKSTSMSNTHGEILEDALTAETGKLRHERPYPTKGGLADYDAYTIRGEFFVGSRSGVYGKQKVQLWATPGWNDVETIDAVENLVKHLLRNGAAGDMVLGGNAGIPRPKGLRLEDSWPDLVEKRRNLGGPGSGNFGHAGRPGQIGGSASGVYGSAERGQHDPRLDELVSYNNSNRVRELTDIIVRDTGLDEQTARDRIIARHQIWSRTSGDSDPVAVQLQHVVTEEFDTRGAALDHLKVKPQAPEYGLDFDRAYVKAEYENTQRWFAERGIKEVEIYRGMLTGMPDGSGETVVRTQPASSWTVSQNIAHNFTMPAVFKDGGVMRTRVPVSRILSTGMTGRGSVAEGEVILLGGEYRVRLRP